LWNSESLALLAILLMLHMIHIQISVIVSLFPYSDFFNIKMGKNKKVIQTLI
jgi:hypothetical protein